MSILAIDYGSKNIGLALVPDGAKIAVPLDTIPNSGKWNLRKDLEHFVKEKKVDVVVVGMPFSMSGEAGPQAQEVQTFVDFLHDETDWNVQIADERLSTKEVKEAAKAFGVPVDSAAAVLIGEIYISNIKFKAQNLK